MAETLYESVTFGRSSTESDFWHTVLRWPRKRYIVVTFSSIEREMGLVESCYISTRTFSTKRRMMDDAAVDTADPPFLWSVRPRIQTSCLMAPQGTQGCPLSSFHGKAACQHPCIIHVSFSPPVKAISLPFNYSMPLEQINFASLPAIL